MKFIFYLLVFALSFISFIRSQNYSQVDSLKSVLESAPDSSKFKTLSDLVYGYFNISIDTAKVYAQKGIDLAKELNSPNEEAHFYKLLARSYYFKTNYDLTSKNLFKALKIYENMNDTTGQINIYYALGITYQNFSQYDLSKKYAEKALTLAKKQKNNERVAAISGLIGMLIENEDLDSRKAMEYYKKAYNYYKSVGNEQEMAVSALNIGQANMNINKYDLASKYLSEANKIALKYNMQELIAGSFLALGKNYFELRDFKKARDVLQSSIERSGKQFQRFSLLSYYTLSRIDSAEGKYKNAYEKFNKYFDLYDSLNEVNNKAKIAELESKYQNEKKQAEINLLEKENQIQALWRNSFIAAFVFALILAGGLFNRYKFKSKTNKKLSLFNEQLSTLNNQLESELDQAASYIKSLLPQKLNGVIETDWKFIPSSQLGGDSFGYNWLDENKLSLYLIDVSGHGVGAALLSTSVLNLLRTKSLPNVDFSDPAQVLNNLNKNFDMEEHEDKYVTMWYGVLDKNKKQITFASAMHPPALYITKDQTINLGKKDIMLGAFKDYNYENTTVELNKSGKIFLFSDGCFEIEHKEGNNFGIEEFRDILLKSTKNGKALNNILNDLNSIKNTKTFEDDYSMIELNFNFL